MPKTVRPFTLVLVALLGMALLVLTIRGIYMLTVAGDAELWERGRADLERLYGVLQKHYEAKKEYPEKLEELRLRMDGPLPANPFDGRPYRYRRTSAGFVLTFLGRDDVIGGATVPNQDVVYTEAGLAE